MKPVAFLNLIFNPGQLFTSVYLLIKNIPCFRLKVPENAPEEQKSDGHIRIK